MQLLGDAPGTELLTVGSSTLCNLLLEFSPAKEPMLDQGSAVYSPNHSQSSRTYGEFRLKRPYNVNKPLTGQKLRFLIDPTTHMYTIHYT